MWIFSQSALQIDPIKTYIIWKDSRITQTARKLNLGYNQEKRKFRGNKKTQVELIKLNKKDQIQTDGNWPSSTTKIIDLREKNVEKIRWWLSRERKPRKKWMEKEKINTRRVSYCC